MVPVNQKASFFKSPDGQSGLGFFGDYQALGIGYVKRW